MRIKIDIRKLIKMIMPIFAYVMWSSPAFCSSGAMYGPPDMDQAAKAENNTSEESSSFRLYSDDDRKKLKTIDRLEVAYQLFNLLDAVQTISCVHKSDCREMNPILGSRPSTGTVLGFKAASGLLHYGMSRILRRKDLDDALRFEVISVSVQGIICGLNFRHSF
jgi:hypothetical protein